MTDEDQNREFLLKQYDQCWDYIKFHYEQRDKCQRFFFSTALAAAGLVVALSKLSDEKQFAEKYILFLTIPIFLLGIFTWLQIILIRKTTVFYHREMALIRRQLKGNYETLLWVNHNPGDKKYGPAPSYFTIGFNFWTVMIISATNSILLGLTVYYWPCEFDCCADFAALWSGLLVFILLVLFYGLALKRIE